MAEEQSAKNFTYDEERQRIRIDLLGSIYGASIEDFEETMAMVMDKLLTIKNVKSVILAKEREYEYSGEQIEALREIANIIDGVVREKLISEERLGPERCLKAYPQFIHRLQYICFNLLRTDPIGAYVELLREERRLKIMGEKSRLNRECFSRFINNAIAPLKSRLESTRLITMAKPHIAGYHLGDRSLYRQFFTPTIRPNFMLTRFMITPPEHAKSVERYKVAGNIQVEIFRLPNASDYLYHVTPPEFMLPEEKYAVLDAARRYMATHRPRTAEFVKSEKLREIFFNIGRDMIREVSDRMGISLTVNEINELASILTRYTAGLGILEVLLADDRVQDVFINSPIESQPVLINHADYEECRTNLIPTKEDAEAWATRLRIESGRPLDEANPVLDVDIAMPGGKARFAIITKPLSPEGLGFAIRRHRDKPWTLPLFIKHRMLNPLASGLIGFLVDGAVSMLVAGGRGAGKTSLLSAIMLQILPKTRIVTIEDTLELPVAQLRELNYNIEAMKSRSVITRVETEMPADEALRTALRLGDSALIVGEVRSTEAKALYEAMRIGALSNIVAGTIHGESAYGVYDRVVNDIGVPPTSFKATDIVLIAKSLRSADGLHRYRRLVEITEVRKHWEESPLKEGGFVNLMEYSAREDTLKPTDTFVNGESEILNRVASHVKEFAGNWQAVWENINLRGRVNETLVEIAGKIGNPEILEARFVCLSNINLHLIMERVRNEVGSADAKVVYEEWYRWLKESVRNL